MGWISGPDHLVDAAIFYCQLLKIADEDFEIEIKEVPMPPNLNGECLYNWDGEFLITLEYCDKKREQDILETLAHEMVHVMQYLHAEENDEYEDGVQSDQCGTDEYWDDPWEIEAYGRQVGLFARWVAYQKGEYQLK